MSIGVYVLLSTCTVVSRLLDSAFAHGTGCLMCAVPRLFVLRVWYMLLKPMSHRNSQLLPNNDVEVPSDNHLEFSVPFRSRIWSILILLDVKPPQEHDRLFPVDTAIARIA